MFYFIEYFKTDSGILFFLNLLMTFFNAFLVYRQQKQQAGLDKEVERHKAILQAEFIKVEMRTTQLFNIYPIMFAKFKAAQTAALILKGPVPRSRQINEQDIDKATKIFTDANDYLAYNMLFLSGEVRKLAIAAKDALGALLFGIPSEKEAAESYREVERRIDLLEERMRKELHNNTTKYSE